MHFNITPILGLAATAAVAVASPHVSVAIGTGHGISHVGARSTTDHLSTRSLGYQAGVAPRAVAHEALQARAPPSGSLPQFSKRSPALVSSLRPGVSLTRKIDQTKEQWARKQEARAKAQLDKKKQEEMDAKLKAMNSQTAADSDMYAQKARLLEAKTARAQAAADAAQKKAAAAGRQVSQWNGLPDRKAALRDEQARKAAEQKLQKGAANNAAVDQKWGTTYPKVTENYKYDPIPWDQRRASDSSKTSPSSTPPGSPSSSTASPQLLPEPGRA